MTTRQVTVNLLAVVAGIVLVLVGVLSEIPRWSGTLTVIGALLLGFSEPVRLLRELRRRRDTPDPGTTPPAGRRRDVM